MRCLLILLLISCGQPREPKKSYSEKIREIKTLYQQYQDQALAVRDQTNGWIEKDCDAMLWTGKYAAATLDKSVNVLAAEYSEEPGRFARRPSPPCWTKEGGDQGSKTTWSRDMAIGGLIPWAWRMKRLDVLLRHEKYGVENNWVMGEPLADGRAVYSPSLIGVVYEVIYALGGPHNKKRAWPSFYSSGLEDYQAHLQIMDIWVRGEVSETTGEPALQGSINEDMYERVVEHAKREPKCWTYQAMLGIYDGMEKAIDLVLSGDFACSYARCGRGSIGCTIAEKLWALDLILRRFQKP